MQEKGQQRQLVPSQSAVPLSKRTWPLVAANNPTGGAVIAQETNSASSQSQSTLPLIFVILPGNDSSVKIHGERLANSGAQMGCEQRSGSCPIRITPGAAPRSRTAAEAPGRVGQESSAEQDLKSLLVLRGAQSLWGSVPVGPHCWSRGATPPRSACLSRVKGAGTVSSVCEHQVAGSEMRRLSHAGLDNLGSSQKAVGLDF